MKRLDSPYCPNGHDWIAENIYTGPNGARWCRTCRRDRQRQRRGANPEKVREAWRRWHEAHPGRQAEARKAYREAARSRPRRSPIYLTPDEEVRFWAKVDRWDPDWCWEWTASKTRGYGHFGLSGRNYRAHRIAYEVLVGAIPQGLEPDHLCRNHGCVNPKHLELVSHQVNVQRHFRMREEEAA